MSVTQQEALASLRILVRMVWADGVLKDEERQALAEALKGVELPDVDVDGLLAEQNPLEELLEQVTHPEARSAVYDSAYTMAYIDGECSPEEQALLDQIRALPTPCPRPRCRRWPEPWQPSRRSLLLRARP